MLMIFVWNPILALNLIFCVIIVVFGYWAYKKMENTLPLYIAAAFGLFGVTHFAGLLGYGSSGSSVTVLAIIRSVAYLTVIIGVYQAATKRL
jgi:hypothetical protein